MDMKLIEQIVEQGYIFIEDYCIIPQFDDLMIKQERIRVEVYQVSIKKRPKDCKDFAIYAVIETPCGDFNVEDRNVTWWLTDPTEEDTTI